MGTRYVEVFKAAPEQMAAALHRAGKSNNLAPGLPHGGMWAAGGPRVLLPRTALGSSGSR